MLRKLLLLAMMVVAALAFTASTAMAQEEPVEVTQEDITNHCNPCNFIVEGESELSVGPGHTGQVLSCDDTFEGQIFEDGSGVFPAGSISLQDHAGLDDCIVAPCVDTPWPFNVGEIGVGDEHLTITFCLGAGSTCEAEVDVINDPGHHYLLTVEDHFCEESGLYFGGDWEIHNSSTTSHDAIEINHLD